MKFKKRQILFDKEVAYNFEKTAGKGLGEVRAFAMISVAGDTVLTFEPVELHFDALPCEEDEKYFNAYYLMKVHATGESVPINYSPVGLPNTAFQYLRRTKMLTFDGLDYDQLEAFVELMGPAKKTIAEHRKENSARHNRYAATVARYGEGAYVSRADGYVKLLKDKVQIDKVDIGKWAETAVRRDFVAYKIKNMRGNNIAELQVELAENKVTVLPVVDDQRYEFTRVATAVAAKSEDLIRLAAAELVTLGYL